MIALPIVRVYSVPYVSWQQIDAYFDQTDLDRIRSPERRKALMQYIAQHKAVPPEYKHLFEKMHTEWFHIRDIGDVTYEEFLLLDYVRRWNYLKQPITYTRNNVTRTTYLTRFIPWEAVRIDRSLRIQLVTALVQTGGLQDKRAMALRDFHERHHVWQRNYSSVFDMHVWGHPNWSLSSQIEQRMSTFRLHEVSTAINRWYEEHDRTLPESLDELLEASYLEALPVHPFTGQVVEYHRYTPPPEGVNVPAYHLSRFLPVSVRVLGRSIEQDPNRWRIERDYIDAFRRSGGTYIQLDRHIVVLVEEERSQEEE